MKNSDTILVVAHVLHPLDDLAIEAFLDREMRHPRGRRSTMPVPLARRKPDDVAQSDFFNGTTRALHATDTRGDDQRLAQRVRVPCRASTGLEGDTSAGDASRSRRLK